MLRPEERQAMQGARGAVLALGDDGLIGFASRSAQDLLGWDSQLVGQPLSIIIPERLRPPQQAGYRKYVEAQGHGRPRGVRQHPALCRDGSERTVQIEVVGFRRPDGSLFLCASLADADQPPPGLDPVDGALAAAGYRRL